MNNNMPGMAGGGSPTTLTPLYPAGYDLTNAAQAVDFLSQMLDDSILQIYGEEYARNFWYGVVVFIGLAAILNLIWRVELKLRYLTPISWRRTSFKLNLDAKYS
jgi:ferric-chelate reductase